MRQNRSVGIDLLRVLAIGMMMAYHAAYDLQTFYGWNIDVFRGPWWWMERACASLFILLSGMSFALSWRKTPYPKKYLGRGARVLCYGLVVTVVTYSYDPGTYVRFGILHLIGVSMMLLPLFVRLRRWNLALAVIVIALGHFFHDQLVSTSLLIPFGLLPPNFISVDYFPLVPWFGASLIGLTIGQWYGAYQERLTVFSRDTTFARVLKAISERSLIIYMLHQPVLLGLLKLFL